MSEKYKEMDNGKLLHFFGNLCAQKGQSSLCIDPTVGSTTDQILAIRDELLGRFSTLEESYAKTINVVGEHARGHDQFQELYKDLVRVHCSDELGGTVVSAAKNAVKAVDTTQDRLRVK